MPPYGPTNAPSVGHTGFVGLNPFRARRRSWVDYVYVLAATTITIALVGWALLG